MNEINKYIIDSYGRLHNVETGEFFDDENAELVKYSDVQQLLAKIEELKHEVSVLGATCEVYSWEPHNLERIYRINEIKAQGIDWAVEQAANDCTYRDDPVIVLEKVQKYADELRGKDD